MKRLLAVVFALAMVLSVMAVPALASETKYLNETFDAFTETSIGTVDGTEYFMAGNAELEAAGKFGFTPDKNTGIDTEAGTVPTWSSRVKNSAFYMHNNAADGTSANPHFAYRKFDTTMTENDTVFKFNFRACGEGFTYTGGYSMAPRFIVRNSKGEVMVDLQLYSTSVYYQVYARNYNNGTQSIASEGINLLANFPNNTYYYYRDTVVYIYPDFENQSYALALGYGDANYDVIASNLDLGYSATGTYDFDRFDMAANVGASATKDKKTCYFDNLIAKDMTADDKAKLAAGLEAFYAGTESIDDFEWGDDYTTTPGDSTKDGYPYKYSIVTKPGKSVASSGIEQHARSGYYIVLGKGDTEFYTTIVDGGDGHGKVFDFNGVKMPQSGRGVNFAAGSTKYQLASRYTLIDFDYKSFDNASIAAYLHTKNSNNSNDYGNPFQGGFNASGISSANVNYSNTKLYVNVGYKKYFPASELDENGNLKVEKWHNVKMIMDRKTQTYDFIVDGKLVAVGVVGVRSATTTSDVPKAEYTSFFSKLMLGTGSGGACHFQLDNFKVKALAPEEAVEMLQDGFEAVIGDGVYTKDDIAGNSMSIYMPFQGAFGSNPYWHGVYKIIDRDSASTVLAENRDNAPLNYAFVGEGINVAANGTVTGVEGQGKRTITWKDQITPLKVEASATEDQKKDAVNQILPKLGSLTSYTQNVINNSESYLKVSDLSAGSNLDIEFDLAVTFTKVPAKATKTYSFLLKRELATSFIDGLEVGMPAFQSILNGKITNSHYVQGNAYARNNTGAALKVWVVLACYDANGDLIAIDARATNVPVSTDEAKYTRFYTQLGGSKTNFSDTHPGLMENIASAKMFVWKMDGNTVTYEPVIPNIVSQAQ